MFRNNREESDRTQERTALYELMFEYCEKGATPRVNLLYISAENTLDAVEKLKLYLTRYQANLVRLLDGPKSVDRDDFVPRTLNLADSSF